MRYGYRPTREEIQQFYLDVPSANLHDAARAIGCSYASINAALKVYGVEAKPRTRNWKRKPEIPQLGDREWLAGQVKEKSYRQIARELGTSVGNVADKLYRLGLAIPRTGAIRSGLQKAYPTGRRGAEAGNWRGGRRYQLGKRGGYVLLYMPEHPQRRKDGYVYEHRFVMEQKLGRLLTSAEVVHHMNGVKDDNRPENLELWANRSGHVKAHYAALPELVEAKAKLARYEARYGSLSDDDGPA